MMWKVFQFRRWWQDFRTYEECGKPITGVSGLVLHYCTRKHNHRGHHKEKL